MPKIECEVENNQITATTDYDSTKLLPEHHDFIYQQITDDLSRLQVQLTCDNHCPGNCQYYKGHMFRMFTGMKTWKDAKADCEGRGGHLATSTSAEKNEFLITVAGGRQAWLGGTDEGTEGTWRWITGEDWEYDNWNPGEPNNSGGEHYLELNYIASGGWNDLSSTKTLGYLCECEYRPRIVVDPQKISHERLSDLLGGSEDGHYHLTEDEKTKLEKLIPGSVPSSDGEPGDVYAIGTYAEQWSGGAVPDEDMFYKLNMPPVSNLRELCQGFAGKTPSGDWYICGNRYYGLGSKDYNITIPNKLPYEGVIDIYPYRVIPTSETSSNPPSYTGYLLSNNKLGYIAHTSTTNKRKTASKYTWLIEGVLQVPNSVISRTIVLGVGNTLILGANEYISSPAEIADKTIKMMCESYASTIRLLTTNGELYEYDQSGTKMVTSFRGNPLPLGVEFSGHPKYIHGFYVATSQALYYVTGHEYDDYKVGDYNVKKISGDYMLTEEGELYYGGKYAIAEIPATLEFPTNNNGSYIEQGYKRIYPTKKFHDIVYVPNRKLPHTLDREVKDNGNTLVVIERK